MTCAAPPSTPQSPLESHFPQLEALIREVEVRRFTLTRLRRFPIAMRELLEANPLSELTPLLEQWWLVPAHTRATVAAELYRGGYRLVEKDRRLEIERRQSS